MKQLTLFAVTFLLILAIGKPSQAGLCDDPTRNQSLCYKMKILRSELDVLDAQRDLMRVNYDLLLSTAVDASQVVTEALMQDPGQHTATLMQLKAELENLLNDAKRKNSDAFQYSNKIKNQCLKCHSNTEPVSGHKWSEISANNWDYIYPHCNTTENPYRCKSMHGMKTSLQYFLAAGAVQHQNFEQTAQLAKEVSRIALDLQEKEMIRGRHDLVFFKNVQTEAAAIRDLAQRRDEKAFEKAQNLTLMCMQCHKN